MKFTIMVYVFFFFYLNLVFSEDSSEDSYPANCIKETEDNSVIETTDNCLDVYDEKLLYDAVRGEADLEYLKDYLSCGGNPDLKLTYQSGIIPTSDYLLNIASEYVNLPAMRLLIKYEANVSTANQFGQVPMIFLLWGHVYSAPVQDRLEAITLLMTMEQT